MSTATLIARLRAIKAHRRDTADADLMDEIIKALVAMQGLSLSPEALAKRIKWFRESGGGGDVTELALLVEDLIAALVAMQEESEKLREYVGLQDRNAVDLAVLAEERLRGWNESTHAAQAAEAKLREAEAQIESLRASLKASDRASYEQYDRIQALEAQLSAAEARVRELGGRLQEEQELRRSYGF